MPGRKRPRTNETKDAEKINLLSLETAEEKLGLKKNLLETVGAKATSRLREQEREKRERRENRRDNCYVDGERMRRE